MIGYLKPFITKLTIYFHSILVAFIVFTFLSFYSTQANSQTIFGGYDCGQWTNRVRNKNHPIESWLTGYLSGLNRMHEFARFKPNDPLDELNSMDQAFVWVDNFCKANPLRKIDGVGLDLYMELIFKRTKLDFKSEK